jgi:hypothetical protein
MALTINDTVITTDLNAHTARYAAGQHGWEVSWLPGHLVDQGTAVILMILADTPGERVQDTEQQLWRLMKPWAAEIGVMGPEEITWDARPPRGTTHHQEQATRQAGPEAGPEAEL